MAKNYEVNLVARERRWPKCKAVQEATVAKEQVVHEASDAGPGPGRGWCAWRGSKPGKEAPRLTIKSREEA